MKFERRKPCGNCPFRKDATLAYWHPSTEKRALAALKDLGSTGLGGR